MNGRERARHLGSWGEALVAEELRRRGYHLLKTGYRCREGEVDLIAEKDGVIAFVEVKTRQNTSFGTGREAVDLHKQRRIILAALRYLAQEPTAGKQPRFDVAEVIVTEGIRTTTPEIRYIKGAFFCCDGNRIQTGGEWDGYTPF